MVSATGRTAPTVSRQVYAGAVEEVAATGASETGPAMALLELAWASRGPPNWRPNVQLDHTARIWGVARGARGGARHRTPLGLAFVFFKRVVCVVVWELCEIFSISGTVPER